MNRIRASMLAMAAFGLMATVSGCVSAPSEGEAQTRSRREPPRPALVNHLAFFKLKDPTDTEELIADCDAKLATIPGVVSYYAGTHVDVGRSTVDGDYDVGFYVGFDSLESYEVYVTHPQHVEVVEKWKPRWEWIRVHDVLDETP